MPVDLQQNDFAARRHECTARHPMPVTGESLHQNWLHADAKAIGGNRWMCPHCRLVFKEPTLH